MSLHVLLVEEEALPMFIYGLCCYFFKLLLLKVFLICSCRSWSSNRRCDLFPVVLAILLAVVVLAIVGDCADVGWWWWWWWWWWWRWWLAFVFVAMFAKESFESWRWVVVTSFLIIPQFLFNACAAGTSSEAFWAAVRRGA